jgi:hypothetical protein
MIERRGMRCRDAGGGIEADFGDCMVALPGQFSTAHRCPTASGSWQNRKPHASSKI